MADLCVPDVAHMSEYLWNRLCFLPAVSACLWEYLEGRLRLMCCEAVAVIQHLSAHPAVNCCCWLCSPAAFWAWAGWAVWHSGSWSKWKGTWLNSKFPGPVYDRVGRKVRADCFYSSPELDQRKKVTKLQLELLIFRKWCHVEAFFFFVSLFFFPLVFCSITVSIRNGCTINLMQIPCILITSEKQGKEKMLFILAHSMMASLKIVLCNIPASLPSTSQAFLSGSWYIWCMMLAVKARHASWGLLQCSFQPSGIWPWSHVS